MNLFKAITTQNGIFKDRYTISSKGTVFDSKFNKYHNYAETLALYSNVTRTKETLDVNAALKELWPLAETQEETDSNNSVKPVFFPDGSRDYSVGIFNQWGWIDKEVVERFERYCRGEYRRMYDRRKDAMEAIRHKGKNFKELGFKYQSDTWTEDEKKLFYGSWQPTDKEYDEIIAFDTLKSKQALGLDLLTGKIPLIG